MNDTQLRYFRALYEHRNASVAAQSVPLSRQGLLKSLDSLETELNVALFDDKTAPLCAPTAYGDAFYAFATRQSQEHSALLSEFRRIALAEKGQIKLGASIGTIGLLGLGIIKEFEAARPAACISCDEVPDIHCDEGILDGTYNLGLAVAPYAEGIVVHELYAADRYIWVSAKDPLSRHDTLELSDFEGYHLGVVGQSFKNYGELMDKVAALGLQLASVDTFSETTQLFRYAMRPGFVAFTAKNVVDQFEEMFAGLAAPVAARPIRDMPWRFAIAHAAHHELTPLEEEFIAHCTAYAHRRLGRRSLIP